MARPAMSALTAALGGWVSRLNSNFGKMVNTPLPIAVTSTTTTLNTDFSPKLYKNCLILVQADGFIYISDGTSWSVYRELLTYHAPFTGGESIATLKTDFNAILTDFINKGWMASS